MGSVNNSHLLICGLGSIGRKHLRCFRTLGVSRIDAYRSGYGTLSNSNQPAPDRVFTDLDRALNEHPAMVIVANPTALHVPTALKAVRAGCHVLVEKPLGNVSDGCRELDDEVRARGLVASVACNLRFHPSLLKLREWIRTGEPMGEAVTARAHFGSYLPDWHPWENYHISYAARRELGGGAALTHIHEIDYILWLFGPAKQHRSCSLGKSLLGLDVDEATAILIRHQSGVLSSITLSLVEKPPSRHLEVVFTNGTVMLDLLTGQCSARYSDGRVSQIDPPEGFEFDDTYRHQAIAFLQAVRGEIPPSVPIKEAIAAMEVAIAARESFA